MQINKGVYQGEDVIGIYIGGQIYEGVFVQDHISNLTHILGGGVGSALGYVMTKNNMGRYSSQTSQ